MLLAPPLSQVLQEAVQAASGSAATPSLTSALEAAALHLDQGRDFLDVVVWTLPPGEASHDLEDRARQDLAGLREALTDVARAAGFSALPPEGAVGGPLHARDLERACRALVAASGRMGQSLEELRRLEEAAPPSFPIPEVDRVLRVGHRILSVPAQSGTSAAGALASASWTTHSSPDRLARGHAALQAFLPGAVGAVQRFCALSTLAAELCGSAELAGSVRAAGQDLQAPLGALMSYVSTGNQQDLRAGCEALEERSFGTSQVVWKLQDLVEQARGGRPAALHLLLQGLQAQRAELPLLVGELGGWLQAARSDAEALSQHPLAALDKADRAATVDLAQAALASMEPVVSSLREGAPVAPEAWQALEHAVLALARVWEPQVVRWATRRDLYSRAPSLRPAAEALGAALLGRLEAAEVGPVLENLEALAGELSVGSLQAGNAEMSELLERQRAGLQSAREALAQGRPEQARAAWQCLEADLPRILEVSAELQEVARPASAGPTEYYDLAGEQAEGAWVPRRLGELEALVRRVACGESSYADMEAEVELWLARLAETRKRTTADLLPALEGDPEQRSYAEFFLERLDTLEEGLHRLQSAAQTQRPSDLEAGLECCRAAGEDMLAMRFQIGAYFR